MNKENDDSSTQVQDEDEVDPEDINIDVEPDNFDPLSLSKAGTGMLHPAVNELKRFIRLVIVENN